MTSATGHTITVERAALHVRAVHDGPLVLRETGCPDRYYLPPEDVRTELLTPSDTRTHCPFKGDASYWSLPGAADLVWAYPEAKQKVAAIEGHFCFYATEVVAE
jgi:uncharacterized protein (DUF427 family)